MQWHPDAGRVAADASPLGVHVPRCGERQRTGLQPAALHRDWWQGQRRCYYVGSQGLERRLSVNQSYLLYMYIHRSATRISAVASVGSCRQRLA